MPLALPTEFYADPDGRVCFYGYAANQDWLVNYAQTFLNDFSGQYDSASLIASAVEILRAQTGIAKLSPETALADPAYPNDPVIVSDGDLETPILSMFTNQPASYKRRPSQQQIDHLSRILGRKPRWWIDYSVVD